MGGNCKEQDEIYAAERWRDGKGENKVPLMQSQALAEGPAPICISLQSGCCYTFFMNAERELATDCCCKLLLLG